MSSTPMRSEDTGRPGERERVNEQDLPENKDAVSMELLKKENGNLKHTADIQAGKILRLEMELHETKQARIDDSACAGNKEHINHLLEFVFFAKVGKWCCFQEVCETGAIGLTEARTGSECPLHGAECKQIMMAR
ncbi:hypothetical protein FOZG_04185 [Fusarium oxysporum Fo47]|uniref:Uncharacterized protein n=1 Tax=Fusarium oxysporum Fo47 TaxID=660027 RepID=W9KW80_FUSOX|nr:hypothetical protein FOZG_04185 [Fusarium oxysporum Fo47]